MYYVIAADADKEGNMISLEYKKDHRGRSWHTGDPFVTNPEAAIFKQPPPVPIVLNIKPERDSAPLPSFKEEPLPIIRKDLYQVLVNAGVDNVQVYQADIYYSNGKLASDNYYAFNIIGELSVIDLERSTYDPEQAGKKIDMQIDSLVIDETKAKNMLMFRLAENITTILVHEKIKVAVEESGIELVRFFEPESYAAV